MSVPKLHSPGGEAMARARKKTATARTPRSKDSISRRSLRPLRTRSSACTRTWYSPADAATRSRRRGRWRRTSSRIGNGSPDLCRERGERRLPEWVDDHPEATTAKQIQKGLESVFAKLTAGQLGRLSKHLSGDAFDVQPVTDAARAKAIKSSLRTLEGLDKFLERGGLVRWHAQFDVVQVDPRRRAAPPATPTPRGATRARP